MKHMSLLRALLLASCATFGIAIAASQTAPATAVKTAATVQKKKAVKRKRPGAARRKNLNRKRKAVGFRKKGAAKRAAARPGVVATAAPIAAVAQTSAPVAPAPIVAAAAPAIQTQFATSKRAMARMSIDKMDADRTAPINIIDAKSEAAQAVAFNYPATMKLNFQLSPLFFKGLVSRADKGKATINANGKTYELKGVLLRVPSEHLIENRRFAAEVQLVHRSTANEYAIVSVLLEDGAATDAELGKLLQNFKSSMMERHSKVMAHAGHKGAMKKHAQRARGTKGAARKKAANPAAGARKKIVAKSTQSRNAAKMAQYRKENHDRDARRSHRSTRLGSFEVALTNLLPSNHKTYRYQGTFHNTNRGSRGPAAASWFVMHDQVKVGAEDLSTLFRIMRIPCLSTRPLDGRKVTLEQ